MVEINARILTWLREWWFIKSVCDGGEQNLSLLFEADTLDHLGEDFDAKFSIFLNLVFKGNHESTS